VDIKQYPCCTGLDFIGGVWTGLIISGFFTFIQCIIAMVIIYMFDKLQLPRCCGWYSGKAGEAALLKLNGGQPNNNPAELESGRSNNVINTAAAPEPVVMTSKAPQLPAPRQSRIFRFFGGPRSSSADERATRPTGAISITANATSASTQQLSAAGSGNGGERRSSGPPPPSAPQWGS
jgi:hypothetical protein